MALIRQLSTMKFRFQGAIAVAAFLISLYFLSLFSSFPSSFSPERIPVNEVHETHDAELFGNHTIDILIATAKHNWHHLLSKESHSLSKAAANYRERRGRHPPPGFAEWFEYAKSKNAIVIEDFFDQIYHDITPYWGLEPGEIRRQARSFATRIVVRDRVAICETDIDRIWMTSWHNLVQSIQQYLPDLDMPINVMDESRIIVPAETINDYVNKERVSRILPNITEVVTEYMNLTTSADEAAQEPAFIPNFRGPETGRYWDMARVGCPVNSASRDSHIGPINFTNPPPELDIYRRLSFHGYVHNWTQINDPCMRPELQALHGTFIEPISVSTSHDLIPMFGGSKIPVNNEILIPAAMYWADDERYSGGNNVHGGPWENKTDVFMWRGAATGGRNKIDNWTGFQRHRFISMINATSVQEAENNNGSWINFKLPDYEQYGRQWLSEDGHSHLPQFLRDYVDAGFVHLVCFPYDAAQPHCPYTDPYYELKPGMPMKAEYEFKYLPDIDGNSFSGRYRGFLLSTSLPIKSTIYREWHDSRLVPWAHFVPMDPTFMDIYGIMEYFMGSNGRPRRDAVARMIALDGKEWAERVIRKEDMQIYTYRLLLEYARVSDDRREWLGYADDLRNVRV